MFWKIQDICYQMGTKPFKIGGEMAEKNEHEVGNPPLKRVKIHCIRFVPFLEGVANFMFIFLSDFSTNFERFSAHLVANILNFPKHPLYALF